MWQIEGDHTTYYMNEHLANLNHHRRSSTMVNVECESKVNIHCRKQWSLRYSRVIDSIENHGKIICMYCSRTENYSGRNNPNCKYSELDDRLFNDVNSEEKAYLLGWIAGDGYIEPNSHIEIVIHENDRQILEQLRDIVCPQLPIWTKDNNLVGLRICSRQIREDVCHWLKINPGKKSHIVRFPNLRSTILDNNFARGLMDSDGHVLKNFDYVKTPRCTIVSTSKGMRSDLVLKFGGKNRKDRVDWSGYDCIAFLDALYANSKIALCRKRNQYLFWKETWNPRKKK